MKKLLNELKVKNKKFLFSFVTGITVMTLAYASNVYASEKMQTPEEVIQTYYNDVNAKNIDSILDNLEGEYKESAENIYIDNENVINHIGIFNISNAEVLNIEEVSLSKATELDMTDYANETAKICKVCVSIKRYEDSGEFSEGVNEVYFILNSDNKIIGCQILDDMTYLSKMQEVLNNISHNNVSLLSYDTPVKKPTSNPSTIKVYRTSSKKLNQ